jgi:TPP-dependent trihydroxycyclohexane-1,2-dione (THcHDO) dehydratase
VRGGGVGMERAGGADTQLEERLFDYKRHMPVRAKRRLAKLANPFRSYRTPVLSYTGCWRRSNLSALLSDTDEVRDIPRTRTQTSTQKWREAHVHD